MTGTRRTGGSSGTTNTGVTNISIMRPESPGSNISYPAGTLYTSQYESLVNQFSAVRFMDYLATNAGASPDVGGNTTVNWTDRLIPADSSQQGIAPYADVGYQGQGGAIEYAVELCNETGKDMWINIPSTASDAYVTSLADGLLYGFNSTGGVYTQPTANPAFAPLNSNLKVYVEYSNEVWNTFPQGTIVKTQGVAAVTANNTNGKILNFDNIGTGQSSVLGQRYWALRTVQISSDFRTVWGNAAMMTTIRPVFEFQYQDDNNTAGNTLGFIDDYFDNADGIQHVTTPEPVNYYLYGAGGGWYNSVNSDTGLGAVTIPNNSFETPALSTATSQANPSAASWTFNGSAGIVSNNNSAANASTGTTIAGSTTTPTSNSDFAIGAGYTFTVGASDIYVNQLGRWIISGNKETHTLFICNSSGGVLAQGTLATSGQTAGQYAYVNIGTVHLLAGQTYSIISTEPSYSWQGFDAYYAPAAGCAETTASGITITSAVTVNMPQGEWQPNLWTGWTHTGSTGSVAGPVDFRYDTSGGTGPVTYAPSTANGSQGAYVQGTGSVSQSLTFPAGPCDVTFYAAQGAVSGSETIGVYIDSTLIYTIKPGNTYYSFYRTTGKVDPTAGAHVLSFVGSGTGTAFIDYVQIESVAAMINSGNMSILSQAQSEVDWAQAYGLKTTGYEGGFEIGGDGTTGGSVAAYGANVDPSVAQSVIATVDEYLQAGGNMPMVFTAVGEYWSLAEAPVYGNPNIYDQNTPKLQGYAAVTSGLPPTDSNATVVPGVLLPGNVSLIYSNSYGGTYEDNGGDILKNTGYLSWNTTMPSTGSYTFTVNTTGSGSANLLVDGNVVGTISASGTYATSVSLSTGVHSVMVQSTGSATITVSQIVVTEVGAPPSPTITASSLTGTTASLSWTSVAGATGYVIGYGIVSDQYTNFLNVGNVTTAAIPGLSTTGVNYMVVYAYNASMARSLPSNQVRLAPRSSDPTALITFDDQADSSAVGGVVQPLNESNFNFTSNNATSGLTIQDTASNPDSSGWPSKVLFSSYWGDDQIITRADGHNFDLYSLDLGDNYQAVSVLLTGYDPTGGTISTYVNFPQDGLQHWNHLVLDWIDVDKVDIHWCDTANGVNGNRFGAITNLLFNDAPPTIATTAAASNASVTGTSTSLSVLGADQAGESGLTYTWAATTLPTGAAAPLFSVNGTNAAKNTTAYFRAAGSYVFTVTISDAYGATSTQIVPVTVSQTLTGLTISPASSTVADSGTLALSAAITDQFGTAMGTQPGSYTWSMLTTGTGTVNATSGLYTAPTSGTGWATIQASGGSPSYTGTVAVYFAPSASLAPNYYAGFPSSTGLSLNGASVAGSALQLTDTAATGETHSVYYSTKLADSSFVTDFGFQITDPVADGFTFCIQNSSATALGSGGGQLGYQYITNSVALKFQLLNTGDVNNVGLYTGGSAVSTVGNLIGIAVPGLSLLSGDVFHAHLSYNGSNLALTLTDATRANHLSVTETYAVNIPSAVGASTAWFGFTATSGSAAMAQNILWWTYGQPIISVSPVVPSLQSSPLQSVTLNSTRPLLGLTASSLSLLENGQSISLGSVPLIASGNGGMSYTVGNLASLTGNLGTDTFTATAAGPVDAGGNAPVAIASVSWTSNTLTALAGQSITIAGAAGPTASVTINGGTPYTINLTTLSPIAVNGLAGNDALTLDFTNASPVPAGGITFTGTTGDSLSVTGTSGADTASLGGSVLTFDSATINLPGVPTLTLNTGAGNDLLTQTSQPTASSVTFNGGTGNDRLNVSAGTYTLTADPSPLTSNLSVVASGSGTALVFNPTSGLQIHLGGLTLTGGAVATVMSLGALRSASNHRALIIGAAGTSSSPTFSIDASSTLDLTDNDLIIHDGDPANANSLLVRGFNSSSGGYWNGQGIISSVAAGASLTTLGIAQPPASGPFDSEPVNTSDVLVKYTYYGDAALAGTVTSSDYVRIDNGFLNGLAGWANGDFNYDGIINGSDYTLIDNAFNTQASPLTQIATATTQYADSTAPGNLPSGSDTLAAWRRKHSFFSQRSASLFLVNP
jgi:hypothetical protein